MTHPTTPDVPRQPAMKSADIGLRQLKPAEPTGIAEGLRETEQQYRALVENQGEGIGIVDENEVFTYANPAAERVFGVPSGSLVGRSLKDLVPPEQFEIILSQSEIRRHNQQSSYELEVTRPNGSQRTLLLTATPRYDDQGTYRGAFGVFRDTTQQKQAELALRESEERYRLLVELLPHGIGIVKRKGILYANQAARRMLDIDPRQDLSQIDPLSLLAEEDRERIGLLLSELVEGRIDGPLRYKARAVRRDGSSFSLEAHVNLIPYQGQRALQLFLIDLTDSEKAERERVRLEEQLQLAQKLEWLGRLAGGIAHDFNNLLSPIIGYCELAMLNLLPDDPLYNDLQQIRQAAEQAKNLVQQLLAFGRKQRLQVHSLNLNRIIVDSLTMLRHLIREDIHIHLELDENLWSVQADPTQIQQILMNLTLNARDAMPQGGILNIRTANVDLDEAQCADDPDVNPGHHAMLEISDQGSGMDAEILHHIFEPFFTTKQPGQGAGLGLATVHGIVKQHHGHIRVSSHPGQGTTFQMFLPSMAIGEETLPQFTPGESDQLLDCTILLVEDDAMVRDQAHKILERYQATVLDARDGYEALMIAKYHKGPIDLLLTDVIMPGLNGRELHQRLSLVRKDLKVLYMSGHAADVVFGQGILGDGTPFIQKPFTIRQLIDRIFSTLNP
ncbi:MAG: PAS domain S-box protein [Bradymonadales bacterium]|nr:PAS domain S-box protein [Bradymonadales bacterium]